MALNGFDTYTYPGDVLMLQLKEHFDFCCFYLGPSPSHRGSTWMNHLKTLHSIGYGVVPIYVGQQTTGPGSHHPSHAQGSIDGRDAVALAAKAGFRKGDTIYLDLENGPPLPASLRDYTETWGNTVEALGFQPGVYCSHRIAAEFDPKVWDIWAFRVPTTARTSQSFPLPEAPPLEKSWRLRQYRQNVSLQPCGLNVDLNTASSRAGIAYSSDESDRERTAEPAPDGPRENRILSFLRSAWEYLFGGRTGSGAVR